MHIIKWFIGAVTFAVAINANATLINYSEGDLPDDFSTSFTINMAGTNMWSGTGSYSEISGQETQDVDTFLLTIATGFEVASIEVLITGINTAGDGFGNMGEAVHQAFVKQGANFLFGGRYDLLNGGALNPGNTPLAGPLGAGDYSFTASLPSNFGDLSPSTADWNWKINVVSRATAAVPEPTTFALIGLGLVGVGFTRRKKLSRQRQR